MPNQIRELSDQLDGQANDPFRSSDKSTQKVNRADQPTVLMAAIAAATIGALMYNMLPIYLGSIEASKSLVSSQTGLIGTAFFLGFNVAGISAFAWIRRFNWRTVSLASLPVLLLSLFLCVWLSAFPALLVGTVVCGVAFGINYTIGSVIVGDSSRPERWYGFKVAFESLAGAVLILLLPLTAAGQFGFAGTAAAMAVCIAVLLPLLLFLPATWEKSSSADMPNVSDKLGADRHAVVDRTAITSATLSLLMLFASLSAMWAFAERMGSIAGFDQTSVDTLLAITLISGISGSVLIAALGDSVNTVKAYTIAVVLVVIALICLSINSNFLLYAVGNCLYMFAWAAGTPLAMAEISRLDLDGRYVALVAPAIGIGGMIGPGIAGWLLQIASVTAVFVYVASTAVASGILMLMAARLSKMHKPATLDVL